MGTTWRQVRQMLGRGGLSETSKAAVFLLLCGMATPATAQDNFNLHGRITGRSYRDDKIGVLSPEDWGISIDTIQEGDQTFVRGAVLRKGNYLLRLCTGCGQVSGVIGGRFSEIAGLVQPWFRSDPGAKPAACGEQEEREASRKLNRVDFWYRRDVAHPYDEDADDCREPRTTDTVWYGSYFEERPGPACGGFFLHQDCLLRKPLGESGSPNREMVFALTYDTADLDRLPRKGDPVLSEVLREATAIVKSIRYLRN
jgi:hypothetical protein